MRVFLVVLLGYGGVLGSAWGAETKADLRRIGTTAPRPEDPQLCCNSLAVEIREANTPATVPTPAPVARVSPVPTPTALPTPVPTPVVSPLPSAPPTAAPKSPGAGLQASVWIELRPDPPIPTGRTAAASSFVFLAGAQKFPVVKKDGKAGVRIPLSGEMTTFTATRILPSGATFPTSWVIRWPGWRAFAKDPQSFVDRTYWFSVGAAFTVLTYSETALAPGIMLAVTAKANAGYTFPFGLVLGGNAFGTTAVGTVNGLEGLSLRFLGANARAGWSFNLPFLRSWIALLGGAYFTTTFSEGSQLGFRNMTGPQLYPVFQMQPGGHSLTTYVKFSPIWTGGGFSFESYELASGLSWRPTRFAQGRLSLSFDFSYLSLLIQQILKIEVMSYNTGLNFHF
jgi:hypothetical protein